MPASCCRARSFFRPSAGPDFLGEGARPDWQKDGCGRKMTLPNVVLPPYFCPPMFLPAPQIISAVTPFSRQSLAAPNDPRSNVWDALATHIFKCMKYTHQSIPPI